MKGFTGLYYNGIPVWKREEFEYCYGNLSERERLGLFLGSVYSSVNEALDKAFNQNLNYLLYRHYNVYLDLSLRKGSDIYWVEFHNGYVHRITGEYVIDSKPTRDSHPCWCIINKTTENRIGDEISSIVNTTKLAILAEAIRIAFNNGEE